jgi:chromosome segregation ATPase
MTSDSTTRWPLLEERAPFATASDGRRGRRLPRSAWLLTGLAFVCGGLVSAAGFSIGWRHQAQHNSATQTALAAATARTHRLERKIAGLRTSLGEARDAAKSADAAAKAATASKQALGRAGAKVSEEATVANGNGIAISSSAGTLTASATRLASELKTLATYLTTTPAGQLDPGYIASQTSYLSRQLTRLQGDAGTLGSSVASFEATLRTLSQDARALKSG